MAYTKGNDTTLLSSESKTVEVEYDIPELKIRREQLVAKIAEIDNIIAEAVKVGVDPK